MRWLTPIWHPNINHLNGSVCIDAAWWTASRSLDRLVIMLGEMLQYKNFHDDPTKPPFPWDPEAARWCRAYRKTHPNAFPVDRRELMRPERVKLECRQAAGGKKKAEHQLLRAGARGRDKAGPEVTSLLQAGRQCIEPQPASATSSPGPRSASNSDSALCKPVLRRKSVHQIQKGD